MQRLHVVRDYPAISKENRLDSTPRYLCWWWYLVDMEIFPQYTLRNHLLAVKSEIVHAMTTNYSEEISMAIVRWHWWISMYWDWQFQHSPQQRRGAYKHGFQWGCWRTQEKKNKTHESSLLLYHKKVETSRE